MTTSAIPPSTAIAAATKRKLNDSLRNKTPPNAARTGALHSFGAVDNVAHALSQVAAGSKSWFARRETSSLPDLEYRTCATSTKADAKLAAERMIGRRDTYMSGAA